MQVGIRFTYKSSGFKYYEQYWNPRL
jgi:hypothetical protein